jgi:hypothetical protein
MIPSIINDKIIMVIRFFNGFYFRSGKMSYNVPRLVAVAAFLLLVVNISKFPAVDFPA